VLAELVDGVLSEPACRALDEHLDRCSQCRLAVGMIATGSPAQNGLPVAEMKVGSTVARFVIEAELGRGAMGIVYRAFDEELRRTVALKVPLRRRTDATDADQLREARVLASIRHPNVVEIYDVVGERFIAMELIEGQTLRAWQQQQSDWRVIVEAYRRAAGGLAAAHRVGVVHRDFKPDNVLVDQEGRVAVTDFGLADPGATDRDEPTPGGTPAYMAPEQIAGAPSSAASDQYSFFLALQEACTGERRRGGSNAALGRPIPAALGRVIARGTRADPEQRFADMQVVQTALQRTVAPRRGVVVASVATATVAVALAAQSPAACDDSLEDITRRAADRVEQRLRAVGLSEDDVGRLFERTAGHLQAHRQRWDEVSLGACRDESTAVTACLEHRVVELEALVGILARGDRATALEVTSLLGELPDPGECETGTASLGLDATMAPAIERLTRAKVALELGRLDEVEATLDALERDYGRLELPAVVMRRQSLQARLEIERGDRASAERRLAAAHRLAVTHGAHRHAAEIATELARLLGVALRRPDDAAPWIAEAERAAWLSGSDEARVSQQLVRARVQWRAGRVAEANTTLDEAFALAQETLGPDHRLLAGLWLARGAVAYRLADYPVAKHAYEEGLRSTLVTLGASHDNVGVALEGLALVATMLGDDEGALESGRWVYEQADRLLGREHAQTAQALATLSVLVARSGDAPEAERMGREAVAVMEAVGDAEPLNLAAAYVNLGWAQAEQGRLEEALASHRSGIAIFERMQPVPAWALADAQTSTGRLLHLTGRTEEALALTRASLGLLERTEGDQSGMLVWPLLSLGDMLIKQDPEAALVAFERALAISDGVAVDPIHRASALSSVAEMVAMLSDEPEALSRALGLAREAEGMLVELGADGPDGLGMLRPLLAELEARTG